jgi:uncharacterized membrane protein
MSENVPQWTDERVERLLGNLLRAGVLIAAAFVLAGGIWYLLRFGGTPTDYRVFRGEPSELRSLGGILGGLFALTPRGLIQFGLLLLIATPVARVALSAVAFHLERDRTYVAITLLVLGTLVYSLSGGLVG